MVKYALALFLVVAYGVLSVSISLLPVSPVRRRRLRTQVTTFVCRWGLRLLGVRVQYRGEVSASGALMVCNHLSSLDILIIAAQAPTVFVSSQEVQQMPLVGTLARLGGTVFVDRRRWRSLPAEQQKLIHLLQHGFRVCLFPEATSSNGRRVLPFRSALLDIARTTGSRIYPYCLSYRSINSQPLDLERLEQLCYFGDMGFLTHLRQVFRCRRITARLVALPPVFAGETGHRKALGEQLQRSVQQAYTPPPPARQMLC
nr:lysophospholipid acyltransferase family protein [Desulfurispira natronophila]